MDYTLRLSKLQATLDRHTALLVSDPAHLQYLTGIPQLTPDEREGFIAVSHKKALCLLTPFTVNPKNPDLPIQHINSQHPLSQELDHWCQKTGIKKILVDAQTLYLSEFETLRNKLKTTLKSQNQDAIDQLRMVKEKREIQLLSRANSLTHQAIDVVKKQLKIGMTEKQVRLLLENFLRQKGVEQMSFPTIVAFGDHSALPHHQPTDRKLKNDRPVLIDMGGKIDGYCADVTRTFWFGDTPSKEFLNIEKIITQAYSTTLQLCNSATSQLTAKDLDNAARSVISDNNYGANFIHTTGHGVGLSVHEAPSLNWKNDQQLKPGFVITIEPGIYLPKKFGYRFENSVALTKNGPQELL